jgi:hypothetical protein
LFFAHSTDTGGSGAPLKTDAAKIAQGDNFLARIVLLMMASEAYQDGGITPAARLTQPSPSEHPKSVVTLSRRFAAAAAMLTLCVGNLAVCAGWRATPEARMACCADDATCPMHKSESHSSRSTPQITQAQADGCCAGSERNDSVTTRTLFVAWRTVTLVPSSISLAVIPKAPALQAWRAFVPLPGPPVAKHLLLSVLLV